ncbi:MULTISPECIES: ATP-binding protein [Fictibacillus]|uniref:ATP-binding protein n=1 Tax=Fictibacillus TaxID=1329200 RepID=UPI0023E43A90|nr:MULTISPECIES: ATP-binding protein [Fictibacillus]
MRFRLDLVLLLVPSNCPLKLSRLPFRKTIDEFNFSIQPTIDERRIRELMTLSFDHPTN